MSTSVRQSLIISWWLRKKCFNISSLKKKTLILTPRNVLVVLRVIPSDWWLIVHESLSLFILQQIQNTRSKVKNIDSSPLQNTCSNILLQLGLIYRTIHSAFGVISFGVIFILWFCIDPVLTVYSFHVKKKCLTLVITKNKRHKKNGNSQENVSLITWWCQFTKGSAPS